MLISENSHLRMMTQKLGVEDLSSRVLYDNSKNKNYSIIVSIPAIREELTIGKVISDIRAQLKSEALVVVCVRDENDPTVHEAISSGADLVVAQPIRGYGLAHLTAMRYGIRKSPQASTIVMVDGDGTYDVSKLKEIVELSCECNCLVIGNRLHKRPSKEAMSLVNYIGNIILSKILFRVLFGKKVSDTQSGLKVFPVTLLSRLSARGMEFSTEVIIRALKLGIPIREVPIEYYPRIGSPPKLRRVRDFISIVMFMLKESIRHFLLVGILSLAAAQAILAALLAIGLQRMHALLIAGEASIWFGFTLNDRYYKKRDKDCCYSFLLRGLKYNLIYVASIIIATILAMYISEFTRLHLVIANTIAAFIVLPINYYLNIRFTW